MNILLLFSTDTPDRYHVGWVFVSSQLLDIAG